MPIVRFSLSGLFVPKMRFIKVISLLFPLLNNLEGALSSLVSKEAEGAKFDQKLSG